MEYIHLQKNTTLPKSLGNKPYKCVVVIDEQVSEKRQTEISRWLVDTGCLYMMAWGINCSSWDDSVDLANLEKFNFSEVPEGSFVMTTWHENEPLSAAFEHCKYAAHHHVFELSNTIILHLSDRVKESGFEAEFKKA